ncbi:MAG: helix-turn-helix transcriptional regulator [Saezia sp.]
MRRADRLFQIIQHLRSRRLTTAQWLAENLEVSERTIYRDIQHLMCCGVPIEGEAGVGYILRKGYDLPPLMFNRDELSVLVLGARIVASYGGAIGEHATQALSKLTTALPQQVQHSVEKIKLFAPPYCLSDLGDMLSVFNQAILDHQVIQMDYQKPQDNVPESRKIEPLGIFFWQDKWTLVGWCLLRNDFRHFRLDRIHQYHLLEEYFTPIAEKSLNEFFKTIEVSQP